MLSKTIKRFYKAVDTAAAEDGWAVTLDARPVKTPAGKTLALPSKALADAIAEEWRAQGETVTPAAMPLTLLATTALDRVGPERDDIHDQLMKYVDTDLVCYRADFPPELVRRQTEGWQSVLDWLAETTGARLLTTTSLTALSQPEEAVSIIAGRLAGYDIWRFTALQTTCAVAGSLVLAMAMVEGRLSAAETFALSQLDETYEIEQWGEDAEAMARRQALLQEIEAATRLLELV